MSEPLNLAPIRAREQAATPGDWTAVEAVPADGTDQAMWSIDQPGWLEGDDHSYMTRADAEFISHARIDIPALLAEVDRLRLELALWEAAADTHAAAMHRTSGGDRA